MTGVAQIYTKAFWITRLKSVNQTFAFLFFVLMFGVIYVKIFQTEMYDTSEKPFQILFAHIPQL